MRVIWISCGIIALGLGVVGIALPLLPTVPFLLLAAFCFARSSERLHSWLINHKTLGPPIRDWQSKGVIRRRAKLLASLSLVLAFALPFSMGVRAEVLVVQVLALSVVALFIWTRPET